MSVNLEKLPSVKKYNYWNLKEKIKNKQIITEKDEKVFIEILDKKLNSCVKEKMNADVPLGAFLSGGLDSSTIVALMKRNSNKTIKTFTIGFSNEDYDETKKAKKISKIIGTDHNDFIVDNKEISNNMSKDIDEMENMLNDYLQFAKTQAKESTEKIDLREIFQIIENRLKNANLKIEFENNVTLYGRKNALQRCFTNIINNGLIYGKLVNVKVQKTSNRAIILFDDNGPGIPVEHYRNVFKPFFRLDKSRSLNRSGVGLGLAIVEDIVHSHGGNIQLSKSNLEGLQVKISLPF